MLTLLEANDRYAMVKCGVVEVDNVTFVLATTEWGDFAHTLQKIVANTAVRQVVTPAGVTETAPVTGSVPTTARTPCSSRTPW